jgi:farnesyl diphosphate synthase
MDGAKAKLVELDRVMHDALAPFREHATALWALGKLAIHRTH